MNLAPLKKWWLLSGLVVAIGCGLIVFGALSRPAPLLVDSTQLSLSSLASGEEVDLSVGLKNAASFGKIRVLGLSGGCGPNGCVIPMDFSPFDLGPGEARNLTVHLKTSRNPGSVEIEFVLYYSWNDALLSKELHVRGDTISTQPLNEVPAEKQ